VTDSTTGRSSPIGPFGYTNAGRRCRWLRTIEWRSAVSKPPARRMTAIEHVADGEGTAGWLGREMMAILRVGRCESPRGEQVDISHQLDNVVAKTREYPSDNSTASSVAE
jgi:hypothetical protein